MLISYRRPSSKRVYRRSAAFGSASGVRSWLPASARRDLGCGGASFEGGRTDLAKRRMAPPLVIEHLDVIEQRHLGLAVTWKPLGLLLLHGGEEALHHRIEAPMCQECDYAASTTAVRA